MPRLALYNVKQQAGGAMSGEAVWSGIVDIQIALHADSGAGPLARPPVLRHAARVARAV